MSKSVPQLSALTTLADTDLLHVVSNSIDYKMTVSDFRTALNYASPKIYRALISQLDPVPSQTSGTVTVGTIWTITTFVAGDDFSNWELLSGTENTTGAVYRASTTAPTTWTNLSDLAYDGRPFIVSTNSLGAIDEYVNTIGALAWSYISTGYYALTLTAAFPENKVFIYPVEAVPPIAGRTYLTETVWWDADSIRLKTIRVVDGTTRTVTDVCLFKTAIEIHVYP